MSTFLGKRRVVFETVFDIAVFIAASNSLAVTTISNPSEPSRKKTVKRRLLFIMFIDTFLCQTSNVTTVKRTMTVRQMAVSCNAFASLKYTLRTTTQRFKVKQFFSHICTTLLYILLVFLLLLSSCFLLASYDFTRLHRDSSTQLCSCLTFCLSM